MIIWIDAQLSPQLAPWITSRFGIESASARHLRLTGAKDREIFNAARTPGTVVMTKDSDFVILLERFGPPPQVLWVRCGNSSNAKMRRILARALPEAIAMLDSGEALVEITDPSIA